MNNSIVSTSYVPLQPPYQIIKYDQDVAMQIGTLIVTIQKGGRADESNYKISTHSHPVVSYENKHVHELNGQLTGHQFLEGAVWNNVEVRDVTTVCLAGATLTWLQFLEVLEHETFLHRYREIPKADLYWHLKRLGVRVLPPEERECTVWLRLMPQPEEAGLSLQSERLSQLFLNISVAEDDQDEGKVFYNKEEKKWDSTAFKKQDVIIQELSDQLFNYRLVLRDLLYDEEVNHFTVTYATDDDRFVELAEYLNNTDLFVNLSFIS
jgi:hypothetical protein